MLSVKNSLPIGQSGDQHPDDDDYDEDSERVNHFLCVRLIVLRKQENSLIEMLKVTYSSRAPLLFLAIYKRAGAPIYVIIDQLLAELDINPEHASV